MTGGLAAARPLALGAAVSPTVLIANLLLHTAAETRGQDAELFAWIDGLDRVLSMHQWTVGIVVAFGFAAYLAVKGVREF